MSSLFTIRDAREGDLPLLNAYAFSVGMDAMPGIERIRVAVNTQDEPVGFCRLQDDAEGIAYVNPIVVYEPWRMHGVGRALIEDAHDAAGELRLIARGESAGFYRVLGFEDMPWEIADLAAASEDCDNCPYREECNPVPMRLV